MSSPLRPEAMTRQQLIDRVEELEQVLGSDRSLADHIKLKLGGQPRACVVLGMLLSREFVSKEALMLAIYGGDHDDAPGTKIANTYIHKVRQMIRPLNCEVKIVWGKGYMMELADRKRVGLFLAMNQSVASDSPSSSASRVRG